MCELKELEFIWRIIWTTKRQKNLEGTNSHLIIIDVKNGQIVKRIINIYRSFNPTGMTQIDLFTQQCDLIRAAFNDDTIIMGDFNLDYS